MHSAKITQRENKIKELGIAISTRLEQLGIEGTVKWDYYRKPIDLSVSLKKTHFFFKCNWRRWDGVVTPTDMVSVIRIANRHRNKQKDKKHFAILASDSGIPQGASRFRDESCERILFLTGSVKKWIRLFFELVVEHAIIYPERCRHEAIVAEELNNKRAKNLRAALAAATARHIDLQVIEDALQRVEKKRRHNFLWWLRTGFPPREAMFQLFPTYSIRAIAPFCTEITRDDIVPKKPVMLHLIERCYENLLLRLPDEQLYSDASWRGDLYWDIQRLATSNLAYHDGFVVASATEEKSSEHITLFTDHYKPSPDNANENRQNAYEFDNFFRRMVTTFFDKIPPIDKLCQGDASLDPEVHFLHSLFEVLAQQLSIMPVCKTRELYRTLNLKLSKVYSEDLWPIIWSHLNLSRGDILVRALYQDMSLPRQLWLRFYERLSWYIGCTGHRYLKNLRKYQDNVGAGVGNVLGRDGLYCALGQFIQDIFKFIGRWEELPWHQKWWRHLTGGMSTFKPTGSIARVFLEKSNCGRINGKGQSDEQSLFNACIRLNSLSVNAFEVDNKVSSYYHNEYSEADSHHLRDIYANRILSGFCNIANMLSKSTPRLLAQTILVFGSDRRLMESHRIVGVPTMGIVLSSLLSLILEKKMSIAHILFSLDMWPRPSRFEKLAICDDGVQTGFTLYSLLREFENNGYNMTDVPLSTIYRFKDPQIDDFTQDNFPIKRYNVAANLDSIRRRVRSCFDFRVIKTFQDDYTVECLSDLTDSVAVDVAKELEDKIKKRILNCYSEDHSLDALRKRVMRICKAGKHYKPCRLFENPDLILGISSYFYDICKEKQINTLIARDEFGVPLAVGICLIHIFSGAESSLNLLIAQRNGTFIEGLADLLQDKPTGNELEIASIGTAIRTQASESAIEKTLKCFSLDTEYINPHGKKLERKTVFTVFRPKYVEHIEPIEVKEADIHSILQIQ